MTDADGCATNEDGLILAAPREAGEGPLPDIAVTPADDVAGVERPASRDNRLGIAASLLMHGLVLYFLFASLDKPMPPVTMLTILPVEVVFGTESAAPEVNRQPAAPQRRSAAPTPPAPRPQPQTPPQQLASLAPPPVIAPLPPPAAPPRDAMQDRLEALSRLRQAENGNSTVDAAGSGTRRGPQSYSVKDYVRAQIERRWSLNVEALRSRNVVVAVHVVLDRDGTVTTAEIVDQRRLQNDAAYYEIALSARAAVMLSSPVSLPAGSSDEDLDMVLNLNPRDVLR